MRVTSPIGEHACFVCYFFSLAFSIVMTYRDWIKERILKIINTTLFFDSVKCELHEKKIDKPLDAMLGDKKAILFKLTFQRYCVQVSFLLLLLLVVVTAIAALMVTNLLLDKSILKWTIEYRKWNRRRKMWINLNRISMLFNVNIFCDLLINKTPMKSCDLFHQSTFSPLSCFDPI